MNSPDAMATSLRTTLGKMEIAFASIDDAIAWTDEAGLLQWANASFVRLTGRPRIQCLGEAIDRLLPLEAEGDDGHVADHPARKALRDGSPASGLHRFVGPDASTRFVEAAAVPLRPGRAATGCVLTLHDVTERRAAIEALRAENAQRRAAEEELRRSNLELEQFAYVASHDLSEPLRKIKAFGERLDTQFGAELSAPARDYLRRMTGAADRMSGLISDLLDYARVTTRARPFEPVDLNRIASDVRQDLETSVAEAGARCETDDLPVVSADPSQIRQVFQNLLGNALKFRRAGVAPEIAIRCRPAARDGSAPEPSPASAWEIRVEDNGIGFEPQYAQRIFKMFQRLHARSEYPGTGIGLAICKKIVERHGGTISATGRPGEGSVFAFTLPSATGHPGGSHAD